MDYQILLLPKSDYWSWVRACSQYVLNYGPNFTCDPYTAAKYMAPRQVISFPLLPGGYGEIPEIERWFQTMHPGIRLDPIPVERPADLQSVFETRIAEKDRYGQKHKDFYLLWPTEYAVVTQPYGANPQIYGRWGFPGHEGVDFRAKPNTNIFACAEGEVYRVHTHPDNHPYGIHVRIQHKHGYKTVYAHFAKALVKVGQAVTAGQVIGKADSSGASVGSHLHLTFKRDGATERGETAYPKDVIDPTPFLVWPEGDHSKMLTRYEWAPDQCLFGAHGRVGGTLEEMDLKVLSVARLQAVKISSKEARETIESMRAMNPSIFLAVRLSADFSVGRMTPESFLKQTESDVGRLYRLGLRYFEPLSNPNLQQGGWRRSWRNGEEFSNWFITVVSRLRAAFPLARFGFPGLSPGGLMSGWRADANQFLHEAEDAVSCADWIGVNCFWTRTSGSDIKEAVSLLEDYRRRFPAELLFVTEFGNPSPGLKYASRAQQYLEFFRRVQAIRGVGAVFAYTISASEGHEEIVWRSEGGHVHPIAEALGQRSM